MQTQVGRVRRRIGFLVGQQRISRAAVVVQDDADQRGMRRDQRLRQLGQPCRIGTLCHHQAKLLLTSGRLPQQDIAQRALPSRFVVRAHPQPIQLRGQCASNRGQPSGIDPAAFHGKYGV